MIPIDFLSPELIEKMKQDDRGYHVYDMFATPTGAPVMIQISNTADPAHWRIIDRTSNVFFRSYAEVQDYIHRRGLVPSAEYAKTHNNNWRF